MTGYDSCAVRNLSTSRFGSPGLSFLTTNLGAVNQKLAPEVYQNKQSVHEFLEFLSAAHTCNRSPSCAGSNLSPRRDSIFQPGSALHKLLTSVPGARPGVRSTNIQKACRFACTLYLNAVLLELKSEPEKLEEYLKRLSIRIVEQELDWNESTETLMWILLFGDETADDAFRQSVMVWWVGRMTNIAKRLNDDSWAQISKLMVGCLAQESYEENTFQEDLRRWQTELMQAPFSWWPEPVVQGVENE